jgi:hypothetical protein
MAHVFENEKADNAGSVAGPVMMEGHAQPAS